MPILPSDLEDYAPVPPKARREYAGYSKAAESKIKAPEGISHARAEQRERERERRLEEIRGRDPVRAVEIDAIDWRRGRLSSPKLWTRAAEIENDSIYWALKCMGHG